MKNKAPAWIEAAYILLAVLLLWKMGSMGGRGHATSDRETDPLALVDAVETSACNRGTQRRSLSFSCSPSERNAYQRYLNVTACVQPIWDMKDIAPFQTQTVRYSSLETLEGSNQELFQAPMEHPVLGRITQAK